MLYLMDYPLVIVTYLNGINVIGLRRSKVSNKDIIGLTDAYKEIFKTESLNENLNKLNGEF